MDDQEPKKVKLTLKQRTWLHEYMEDGNATRAALVAHYPDFPIGKEPKQYTEQEKKDYNSAASIGSENLHKLELPLDELMNEAGLTDVYLTLKLKENLNATKLYGMDSVVHMDGMARNKALEIALKSKGKLIDRMDHTTKGQKILQPLIIPEIKPRKVDEADTTVS